MHSHAFKGTILCPRKLEALTLKKAWQESCNEYICPEDTQQARSSADLRPRVSAAEFHQMAGWGQGAQQNHSLELFVFCCGMRRRMTWTEVFHKLLKDGKA